MRPFVLCAGFLCSCAIAPPDVGRLCAASADCAAGTQCLLPAEDGATTGICRKFGPAQGLTPRLEARIVCDMPFDEDSGPTADDASGGPFVATVFAARTGGRYGGGLRFDGTGSVNLDPRLQPGPDDPQLLDEVDQGAITVWAAWDVGLGASGYDPIFSAGDGDGAGDGSGSNEDGGYLELGLDGDAHQAFVVIQVLGIGGDQKIFARAPLPDPGEFHHLAWLVDHHGTRLLIDGAPATLTYETGDPTVSAFFHAASGDYSGYTLGNSLRPAFEGFQGVLDEFRIYAAPLTDSDVVFDMGSSFSP